MNPYEKEILNALKDGKPRNFQQILDEIGFYYNTLRLASSAREIKARCEPSFCPQIRKRD